MRNLQAPPYDGVNTWTLSTARKCQLAGLTEAETETVITSFEGELRLGRYFTDDEITRAINTVFSTQPDVTRPKWPPVNQELQRHVIAEQSRVTLATLQHCSPEALDQEPRAILEKLFPGDPLLCVSREFDRGTITHQLSGVSPAFLKGASFIVPSPMSAKTGRAKDGRLSAHCLDNTGARRYLVVEIDDMTISKDKQVGIINHLAAYAALVAVTDSAGKSLHALFLVEGPQEGSGSPLERLFAYAVSLGADPRMWVRSQFTRMPNGTRQITGGVKHEPRRQSLVYFNPTNRRKGSPIPQL